MKKRVERRTARQPYETQWRWMNSENLVEAGLGGKSDERHLRAMREGERTIRG